MSSVVNIGSHVIGFDYKQDAKSEGFNRGLNNVLDLGFYSGGTLSINAGANAVDIQPYKALLQGSSTVMISDETEIVITYQPAGGWPLNETIILYVLFDWSNTIDNYPAVYSRLASSGAVPREAILGTVTTDGAGTVTAVSYDNRTYGFNKSFFTDSIANEPWISDSVLLNNWTGTIYYRKNILGLVEVRLEATAPGTFVSNQVYTLPLAYRPAFTLEKTYSNNSTNINVAQINTDGTINLISSTASDVAKMYETYFV